MAERIKPELVTVEVFETSGAPVYKDEPEKAFDIVSNFISGDI